MHAVHIHALIVMRFKIKYCMLASCVCLSANSPDPSGVQGQPQCEFGEKPPAAKFKP